VRSSDAEIIAEGPGRFKDKELTNKIAERSYEDVKVAYLGGNKEYRSGSRGNAYEDDYVLDVGAGQWPRGSVALDISPPRGRVTADYVVGDACHLPFRSNAFRKVLSYGALNFFPSDVKFFAEAARVLKKGCLIVISACTHYDLTMSLLYLLRKDVLGAFRLILNFLRRRYRWYSVSSLKNMLTHAGFKVVKSYPNVYFYWRPTTKPLYILVAARKLH
jgi:SAM-dependent methyltransferase